MPDIRRILVAVKVPQATSPPAVLKAGQLARAWDAELELFHGLETPIYTNVYSSGAETPQELQRRLRQQAVNRLDAIADRLRQHGIRVTVSAEWDFPVYEAIVRRALSVKADFIVASQHPGRHKAPRLLRLTDWELVRSSPVPVLLVKNPHPYRHPAILTALDPTHAFAKPLQLDREILRIGRAVSQGLRGTLHAVHAFPLVPAGMVPFNAISSSVATPVTIQRIELRSENTARTALNRLLKQTRIARSRRYLIAGAPIDAIVRASRESHSAVVVMGAISRSGLKRIFIGNTAERILDELSCDILVVKPAAFRNCVPPRSRGARVVIVPTAYT